MCCLLVVCFVTQSVPVLLSGTLELALIVPQCFAAYQQAQKELENQFRCANAHTDNLGCACYSGFHPLFSYLFCFFPALQFTQHGVFS